MGQVRRRRPIPKTSDLSYPDFRWLVEFGRMTWADVRDLIHARMVDRVGHDPYAHLREESDD